jgi:sulfur-oxidizing protein SoxY
MERRAFIASGPGAAALALAAASSLSVARAESAPGWNKAAFEAKTLAEVARGLGATGAPTESRDLVIQVPEIAENGSVVRVSAQSNVPNTTMIAFVVEKNPNALVAAFEIPTGTDASVATNVKMAETSNVYALVKAGDKYWYAVKEVKVTIGGCGG